MLKEKVAERHKVNKPELFACDAWKSKIHRELLDTDSVSINDRKSDDIFMCHSKPPNDDFMEPKKNYKHLW